MSDSEIQLDFGSENEASLELVSGPNAGAVYSLGNGLRLGRSEENDVVLPSGSVSREHAIVQRTNEGGYIIRDNGSKNGVQINGQTVDLAPLEPGDSVQIGEFVFRYQGPASNQQLAPSQSPGNYAAAPVAANQSFGMASAEQAGYAAVPKKKGGPNKRLLLYGGLALLVAVLFLANEQPSGEKDKELAKENPDRPILNTTKDLKTKAQIELGSTEKQLSQLEDPLYSNVEREVKKFDYRKQNQREAEQYFRKGRREFLNQNFHRAIQSLEAALGFDRNHKLSFMYRDLAIAAAEREAKNHLVMATTYFETLQYARAVYHFEQVIDLLQHRPTHKSIVESKKYIKLSRERLRGAELFP